MDAMAITIVNLKLPELSHVLGNPDLVAQFFSTLGTFLTAEQRQTMSNNMDADLADFPVNNTVCLTSRC